jgi:VWFA-related protein
MTRLTLLLLLAASAAGALQSGSSQQAAGQQPVFKSRANFVRVDVYPTANGQPVQDLTAADFEIQEDGAAQAVDTFEHIVIRPAGPQATRAEPNTIAAMNEAAANPRSRVFVLFLDQPHVQIDSGWRAREPLVRFIDRILGPDDLVGIMTPAMSVSGLTLARKTDVLAAGLRDRWPWGERFTLQKSQREKLYEECYPPTEAEVRAGRTVSQLAQELIDRRRERATLDSLMELVQHLHGIREERKAIVTITEGWLLFREKMSLTDLRTDPRTGRGDPIPGVDPPTVGPDGKLTTRSERNSAVGGSRSDCDRDRQELAMMDDDRYFRDVIDEANRSNASFYTVDPRGLAPFDSAIGPERPPPIMVDQQMLRTRQDNLRVLASNTDGLAVIENNSLDVGFKRIADDLTSYYLLGYYSTNQKLDGKYRAIKVRVKRPGVDVRARKGYRAATEKEVAMAAAAATAPVPAITATIASAMGTLDRVRPGARFLVNAVPGTADGKSVSTIWVAGELVQGGGDELGARGGTAEIEVNGGGASGTGRVTLAAGERAFVVPVALSQPLEAGAVDIRVRFTGATATDRATDTTSLDLATSAGRPLLFRRGPSTGNRVQPAGAFQFSRTDRARFEIPIGTDAKPGAARLLDKTGRPLGVPVTVGERTDAASGARWLTAEIVLAPLAPADYLIEITWQAPGGEQRTMTAIRITR